MESKRLSSWSDFSRVAEHVDVSSVGSYAYGFRGQSDATWELKPSLLRYLPSETAAQQALDVENAAVNEFKTQAHLHLPQSLFATTTDSVSWLTVMQHHGAPTRMLDWTASIYVAAYFAVHGTPSSDGAIWLVHTNGEQEYMNKTHGESAIPTNEAAMRNAFFVADAPEIITFVGRLNKSDRMIAQQGFFSVCRNVLGDHGAIFRSVFSEPNEKLLFDKLIIPSAIKPTFARRLRAMNITANALFPGIDGLGKSVAELIQLASLPKST